MKIISIIIATYNAGKYLDGCLQSIIRQKDNHVELIVIDGKSNDNTIAIIKNNKENIDYWLSEVDDGIYDAWNKGILASNGQWLMFIGADDILKENVLNLYKGFIKSINPYEMDMISGQVQMIDQNGKTIRVKGWGFEWPRFLKEMTIAHPGALHSVGFFEKYGVFNTKYKIVGDYELILRAGNHLKHKFIKQIIVEMREGGTSDGYNALKEHYLALRDTAKCTFLFRGYNFLVVYLKLFIKRSMRKFGFNVYLRG